MNYIGGSIEVLSRETLASGFGYSVPVGTDTYDGVTGYRQPFKYVYLALAALEDNTQVFVDNLSGDTASFTLNKGEHWYSEGFIGPDAAPAVFMA